MNSAHSDFREFQGPFLGPNSIGSVQTGFLSSPSLNLTGSIPNLSIPSVPTALSSIPLYGIPPPPPPPVPPSVLQKPSGVHHVPFAPVGDAIVISPPDEQGNVNSNWVKYEVDPSSFVNVGCIAPNSGLSSIWEPTLLGTSTSNVSSASLSTTVPPVVGTGVDIEGNTVDIKPNKEEKAKKEQKPNAK